MSCCFPKVAPPEARAQEQKLHGLDGQPTQERPKRTGKWFLVHRDRLSRTKHVEQCDSYEEFFKHHPNGKSVELVKEFVCVQLTDKQIKSQRSHIRLASYRWEKDKSFGGACIPGNYEWFLRIMKERDLIGWMDFCGHAVVNAPTKDVIEYMGDLYAENITLAQWLVKPALLRSQCLSRCWIYQEMSFGALDELGVRNFLQSMRTTAKRASSADNSALVLELVEQCHALAELLNRRGWLESGRYGLTQSMKDGEHEEIHFDHFARSLMRSYGMQGDFGTNDQMFGLVTLQDDSQFERALEGVVANLTTPTWKSGISADGFLKLVGHAAMKAYQVMEVTKEYDRKDAVTMVGRSIVQKLGGPKIDAQLYLRGVSRQLLVQCDEVMERGGASCLSSLLTVNPAIRKGERLLAYSNATATGRFVGSRLDIDGNFKTKSGGMANWNSLGGYSLHNAFVSPDRVISLAPVGKHIWVGRDGVEYEIFACNLVPVGSKEDLEVAARYRGQLIARCVGGDLSQPRYIRDIVHRKDRETGKDAYAANFPDVAREAVFE